MSNFISIKDMLKEVEGRENNADTAETVGSSVVGSKAEILLKDLNEEQQEAVKHTEGPVLILAGAGSGKTRTLTYRIAYLLENGVSPYNILALTFTNKAAREIKDRIAKISTASFNALWMGTFHSIFSRLLRVEADKIGYTRDFIIYDTDDSVSLINRILKEQILEDKDGYKPKSILGRISSAKSAMISSEDYILNKALQDEDRYAKRPKLGEIYSAYQNALRRSNAMDFDDLLFYTYTLFRDEPSVLEKYRKIFKYILVDEYQDTSRLQYLLIRTLAVHHRNLCVVGDDSQSIYAFRGATIRNILDFQDDYPDTRIFKLEQNYRSSGNIVGLSNAIIAQNKNRLPKTIWTANTAGAKVQVFKSFSDRQEGEDIVSRIARVHYDDGGSWCDFAILYRTNRQSKNIEDALRRQGIPYKIYGNVSFYQRKEIKNVLAYCRWAVNPYDEQALLSCINNPRRGIGDTSVDKLQIFARENKIAMWDILSAVNLESGTVESNGKLPNGVDIATAGISTGILKKMAVVALKVKKWHVLMPVTPADELLETIWKESDLKHAYEDEATAESKDRIQNVEELLGSVKEWVKNEHTVIDELTGEILPYNGTPTLAMFLPEIALLTDQDTQSEKDEQNSDKVVLMTVHSAKGLEFPYVFVTGLEDGLFPSSFGIEKCDLEEERRLFYVAVTRAKKQLWLSCADMRFLHGSLQGCMPSPFLLELDSQYAEVVSANSGSAAGSGFDNGGSSVRGGWSGGGGAAGSGFDNGGSFVRGGWNRGGNSGGAHGSSGSNFVRRNVENTHATGSTPFSSTPPRGNFKKVSAAQQATGAPPPPAVNNTVGQEVLHSRFGRGTILEITGDGANLKYTVDFAPPVGIKTLLAAFAKLKPL
ncbi:MAG: UvrD-helicase domain-containing protein [Bacteroidales bacterium]|nr:UvrD-helicase domain-containing protein [Bacteroidales bacterium]